MNQPRTDFSLTGSLTFFSFFESHGYISMPVIWNIFENQCCDSKNHPTLKQTLMAIRVVLKIGSGGSQEIKEPVLICKHSRQENQRIQIITY